MNKKEIINKIMTALTSEEFGDFYLGEFGDYMATLPESAVQGEKLASSILKRIEEVFNLSDID